MKKMRTLLAAGGMTMLAGLGLVSTASAQTMPPPADVDEVVLVGRGAVKVLTYPARVVSADLTTREVVFESPDGKRWELVIPPGVADIAALQNSEKVVVRVLPAEVTALGKAHQGKPGEVINQATVNGGLPGLPDGFGLISVTMTTIFVGIDKTAGTVTFEDLAGQVRTMPAFNQKVLADLQQVEPGDLAQITYLDAIAITMP